MQVNGLKSVMNKQLYNYKLEIIYYNYYVNRPFSHDGDDTLTVVVFMLIP